MPDDKRVVALDMGRTTFIESYRIQACHGVMYYALEHPNWSLVFNLACFSLTNKFSNYSDLKELGVSGLIFLAWGNTQLDWVLNSQLHAVSFSPIEEAYGIPSVISEDDEMGIEAADHFLERGFRSLACCTSKGLEWELERARGFRQAAENAACQFSEFSYEPAFETDLDRRELDNESSERMIQWLNSLEKPVGIFATNDTRAFHVLETCKAIGIQVPREVAIVGVDNNVLICNSIRPSLSSVEPNALRVGYEAAALLDRMMAGEDVPKAPLLIPPKGIATRMSSDVLAVEDPAVVKALEFIHANLSNSIGVEDIVDATKVSRSTLENRFRSMLGSTIAGEIARQRLRHAKTLLLDTDIPVEEVARLSGFRRATYFSSFFNTQTGLAPGAWRDKFKGANTISMDKHYGTMPESFGT